VFDRLSGPGTGSGRDSSQTPPGRPAPFRRPGDRPELPAQSAPPRRPTFPADEDEADENGELRYERFDDDAVQDNIYEDE